MCKFIVDELHNNLSNGKYSRGCLLYCMVSTQLLFVYSYFFLYFWSFVNSCINCLECILVL
jgi:hypothetical protein